MAPAIVNYFTIDIIVDFWKLICKFFSALWKSSGITQKFWSTPISHGIPNGAPIEMDGSGAEWLLNER